MATPNSPNPGSGSSPPPIPMPTPSQPNQSGLPPQTPPKQQSKVQRSLSLSGKLILLFLPFSKDGVEFWRAELHEVKEGLFIFIPVALAVGALGFMGGCKWGQMQSDQTIADKNTTINSLNAAATTNAATLDAVRQTASQLAKENSDLRQDKLKQDIINGNLAPGIPANQRLDMLLDAATNGLLAQTRLESKLEELRVLALYAIRFDFAVNDLPVTNGSVVRLNAQHGVRIAVKNVGEATAEKLTIAFCVIDTNSIVSPSEPSGWQSVATVNILAGEKEIGKSKVWTVQAQHLIAPGDRFSPPESLLIASNVTTGVRAELSAYSERSKKATIGLTLVPQ